MPRQPSPPPTGGSPPNSPASTPKACRPGCSPNSSGVALAGDAEHLAQLAGDHDDGHAGEVPDQHGPAQQRGHEAQAQEPGDEAADEATEDEEDEDEDDEDW